jgi:hypothetical protein
MSTTFGTQETPQRRRPIAWYAPAVLWQAGREWLQSASFQRNLDRRETLPADLQPLDFSGRTASQAQPFGLDFMSDTGDGGNATFSVAQALLKRELTLPDTTSGEVLTLPEGDLLVLGGDLAYPSASPQAYQYRLIEPLALALDPHSRFVPVGQGGPDSPRKFMAAIPQNHDWFDSASTFCRYFVNYDKGAVAGARTPQRQTWFAARLPHRFWLLGLDFALVGDLDRQQLEAFSDLLQPGQRAGIQAGDDVLLLYPEPVWTRPLGDGAAPGYPKRYQRLEAAIEARGARIRLRLAGDLHHYARETLALDPVTGCDSHLVTCGVGGAFTDPTHCANVQAPKVLSRAPEPHAASGDLQARVRVGRVTHAEHGAHLFEKQAIWPAPALSRRLSWTAVWSLFKVHWSRKPAQLSLGQALQELWHSNVGFALCLGLMYGLIAYVNSGPFQASLTHTGAATPESLSYVLAAGLWLQAVVMNPLSALAHLALLAACLRVAWEGPANRASRLASGLLHGMAHGHLVFALYWWVNAGMALSGLAPLHASGTGLEPAAALVTWASVAVLGGVAGGLLFGAYLALMCGAFGQLPNNAFGALAIGNYKGFLRCRLTEKGLEVMVVGLDKVPERGSFDPELPAGWRVVDRFHIRKTGA